MELTNEEFKNNLVKYFQEDKDLSTYLTLEFIVNDKKCHQVLTKTSGSEEKVLIEKEFNYDNGFKKDVLEPSVEIYAKARNGFLRYHWAGQGDDAATGSIVAVYNAKERPGAGME